MILKACQWYFYKFSQPTIGFLFGQNDQEGVPENNLRITMSTGNVFALPATDRIFQHKSTETRKTVNKDLRGSNSGLDLSKPWQKSSL